MLSVFPHATTHRAARRILLVDDDASLRTSLALLLTADGHRAIEAAGGEEALGLLGRAHVDLVITDLEMAGVSGWDVVRAAKDRSPSLPVILLTGWGDQAATAAPAATDVDAILAKPFQLEAFLRLVAEYTRD
jgi:DNA-binding NtrC family response regulator